MSNINDKKKKIRLVISECLDICLNNFSIKILTDNINNFENAIRIGIYDREQIIRDTYKKVYYSYKSHIDENIVIRYSILIFIFIFSLFIILLNYN